MNTLPNLDFKVSPAAMPVSRASASSPSPAGADFSEKFKASLDAISRDEASPKTESTKPADPPRVTQAAEDKPEDEVADNPEGQPEDRTASGQNLPVVLAMVPANIALAPQPALQSAVPEGGANTGVAGVPVVDVAAQVGPGAMPVTDAAKGVALAAGAPGQLPLGQVPAEAYLATAAAKTAAVDAAAQAVEAAMAQAGVAQVAATPQAPSPAQLDAVTKLKSDTAANAQVQAPSAMALEAAKADRVETAIPNATANATATTKPVVQPSSVDSIGSANQALLQARHSEQLLAAASQTATPDNAAVTQTDGAEPEQNPLIAMGLAKGGGNSSVVANSSVGPQMATSMKPEMTGAPMSEMGQDASRPSPLQEMGAGLPDKTDAKPKTTGESLFPALGTSPVLGGHAAVTTPGMHSSSTHNPAPVMMVPAAQLNGELVKFAGGGGGRAVMEITSPDLGALKIDLSIDGRGVARMVVEASSSAARDQLEQGLRQLHDEFGGIGLSLNVDVRQGGGDAQRRDLPSQTWGGPVAGVGPMSSEGPRAASPASRVVNTGDDKTLVHFYA